MPDYFTHTVIQPTVPLADMTPLERLVLTGMFDSEPDGDGLYFFSESGPNDLVSLPEAELKAAFTESAGRPSRLQDYLAEAVAGIGTEMEVEAELDLGGAPWELFFQDIVRRSPTLTYLTVVSTFTCSKMRPDGFGGSATLISAQDIKRKSTDDILEAFISAMEGGGRTPA
jgi:hypothetical protein